MSQRTKNVILAIIVFSLYAVASHMDYEDQIEAERIDHGK